MTVAKGLSRRRICFVVSAPETAVAFLNPHIERLSSHFDIDVVMNAPAGNPQVSDKARQLHVPIQRRVELGHDSRALWDLHKVLRRGNYTAVHSVTPKAGLLTALGSIGLKIPIRIHWFTGQVWANRTGKSRAVLRVMDKVIARRTTKSLVDSGSQRDFLIAEGVVRPESAVVLASGSICGVDAMRFHPDVEARAQIRAELGIPESSPVVVFVGRLNRDKGVLTLASAFGTLDERLDSHLLLIGTDEEGIAEEVETLLGTRSTSTRFLGHVSDPERYLAAADIFCLPSLREGFGLSVIEAGAVGLPSVVSNIYGLTDAVLDGETGVLVSPGDPEALRIALGALIADPEAQRAMGQRARSRAQNDFRQEIVTQALEDLYQRLIAELEAV